MTTKRTTFTHFKQQGEWAELLFMARAAEYGLAIARPWGDSAPYDVAIVATNAHSHRPDLLRVQVKSTQCQRRPRIQMSRRLQRRPLPPRPARLHRRLHHHRRRLVHHPRPRHPRTIRSVPNSPPPGFEIRRVRRSLAPPKPQRLTMWVGHSCPTLLVLNCPCGNSRHPLSDSPLST
jgi:hypothetical protein